MKRPELAPEDVLELSAPVDLEGEILRIRARADKAPILDRPPARELDAKLAWPIPSEGAALDEVLDEVDRVAVAHARKNAHPGFFGYVCGPGLPTDPIAHAIAATLNQNATGFASAPGAAAIERALIGWMAELAGFPSEASGLVASGGSLANFTAIAAALRAAAGPVLARDGLAAAVARKGPFFLDCSEATHFSVARAALLLGLGEVCVRKIPVDSRQKMIAAALDENLAYDLDNGKNPVCVVASAGSTTTGAIDPLPAIADVCDRRGVWMHVDGAYGGGALLSSELRPRLAGIKRAQSFCVDIHKWLYSALGGSIVVFRDVERARDVFFTQTGYVRLPRETPPDEPFYVYLGLETSRPFRALAPWLALRHFGVDRIGRNIAFNAACARYLAHLVAAEPDLELLLEPELSIVCFRFAPQALSADRAGELNDAIVAELQREGSFFLSPTTLEGRSILRACMINVATRAEHVESLVKDVLRIGRKLMLSSP